MTGQSAYGHRDRQHHRSPPTDVGPVVRRGRSPDSIWFRITIEWQRVKADERLVGLTATVRNLID
ncbi:hypothetical protein C1I99_17320 [Micromonospora deserti]|uniref:Uncharacterized protein n=2 Tax=Micromonospora deserti TaxID=2070366 RepID=A0A2W2CSN6_9ACTN|nr:hypothetical protein C1I99_17320 [Micromonospora deserti]